MFENKIKQCEEQKKIIDSFRPFSYEQTIQLKEHFKIGLTYSSNALEGNTLSLIETKVIIEDGLTIGGKTISEIQEATGHAKAYDFMFDLIQKDSLELSDILKLHKLFYEQIDSSNAGKYRDKPVFISGMDTKFPPPDKINQLMKFFMQSTASLQDGQHPIEHAAVTHNKFVTIHPFLDGNGRTARLLMNLLLIRSGHTITIIPPVYRSEYIKCAYEGNKNNHHEFINFLSCMVYESQKEYLSLLNP
jgi:Fic family protein